MKLILVSLICFWVLSCKETSKEIKTVTTASAIGDEIDASRYPEAMRNIFEAHGGLTAWENKRILSFEIVKPDKREKHTIDLHSRNEKIEMPGISMGSNGKVIWLHDDKSAYKGDAVFYHNLMFYFYAMPFVLADDGINYAVAESLEFEGTTYPGIRISYNEGIGLSAKDEYFVHYDPNTFKMEWLGYTVTFRSGEKSDNIKWIRYNDRMYIDGLLLPKSLTWHEYEGRIIKEARAPLKFENVTFSETALPLAFFEQPDGAKTLISEE